MGVQQSSPISQESGHLNHLAIKKPNGMLLIMIVKASISKENETGCSGLEHWDDPEGWDGEGGGSGVQDGEHMYPWRIHVNVCQKPLQYYKLISDQLK